MLPSLNIVDLFYFYFILDGCIIRSFYKKHTALWNAFNSGRQNGAGKLSSATARHIVKVS